MLDIADHWARSGLVFGVKKALVARWRASSTGGMRNQCARTYRANNAGAMFEGAAVAFCGASPAFSISGGAFLEVLEGKTPPAFEILSKRAG